MYSVPVGACVSSVVPWFSLCSLQISVLFVLMRVEISLLSSGMLGSCGVFFASQISVCYFVANGLW